MSGISKIASTWSLHYFCKKICGINLHVYKLFIENRMHPVRSVWNKVENVWGVAAITNQMILSSGSLAILTQNGTQDLLFTQVTQGRWCLSIAAPVQGSSQLHVKGPCIQDQAHQALSVLVHQHKGQSLGNLATLPYSADAFGQCA